MASDTKIKKINVTQQVAAYIREKIESGEWPEGSKIESEAQLSEKLGVSRVSIRGAIRQFIALGKLESIQGKGTFVRSGNLPDNLFSSEDCENLKKVMQFRITIEQDAAFYAAANATEEDISFLQRNVELMIRADQAGDAKLSWDYDIAFHKKVASMSQNQFYYDTLDLVFRRTYDLHMKMIQKLGTRFANVFHPMILNALATHNQESARASMRAHLDDFISKVAATPDYK